MVAADIYGAAPHVGRGGWTWYTGAASWMYRVGLETLLGFTLRGDNLEIKPCIPQTWKGFNILFRRGKTQYTIEIINQRKQSASKKVTVKLDGALLSSNLIPLVSDDKHHKVIVILT